MTQPPFGEDPGSQAGQPDPGYGQPQYGSQPDYGQQYGQPQYGQPQYRQLYGEQLPYGQPQPAPSKTKRTRLVLTSSAAVVVLAAGGVATYAAVSDSGSSGASSPRAAVQSALTDLANSDLVGFLDDLAPGERTALAKPIGDVVDELKRNDVLAKSANPNKVGGLRISATKFTYAPTTITVNDHVQIVQITGGSLTVSGDASKVPLSKDFLDAVVPGGLHGNRTSTVDIASELRKSGDKSVRIAAQKVGSSWYPSLFYTIADYATYQKRLPTAADAIPAKGASSAVDAVRTALTSALAGDIDGLIGVLSPDELAVLHDYGHLAIPARSFTSPLRDATLSDVTFDTEDLSGGGVLVTLKSLTITKDGKRTTVQRSGDCISTTRSGSAQPVKLCPGTSSSSSIGGLLHAITGQRLTTRQTAAVNRLFSSATKGGIVASQTDGRWYVNPVRTVLTEVSTLLGGLQNGDVLAIAGIFGH